MPSRIELERGAPVRRRTLKQKPAVEAPRRRAKPPAGVAGPQPKATARSDRQASQRCAERVLELLQKHGYGVEVIPASARPKR